MGRAIYCDRCQVYEKNLPIAGKSYTWRTLDNGYVTQLDPASQREPILICPDCNEDFKKFMRNET